jgi:hypothetical protein
LAVTFSRRIYETPRARHAPLTSVSPSIPVAPFQSDVEKGFWLRSRFAPRLDVLKQYASPLRSLRPCQKTFLNILKISDSAIGYTPSAIRPHTDANDTA